MKPKVVKITKWAGNRANRYALKYETDALPEFSFIHANGEIGDVQQTACPTKWKIADVIDVPSKAFEEVNNILDFYEA